MKRCIIDPCFSMNKKAIRECKPEFLLNLSVSQVAVHSYIVFTVILSPTFWTKNALLCMIRQFIPFSHRKRLKVIPLPVLLILSVSQQFKVKFRAFTNHRILPGAKNLSIEVKHDITAGNLNFFPLSLDSILLSQSALTNWTKDVKICVLESLIFPNSTQGQGSRSLHKV